MNNKKQGATKKAVVGTLIALTLGAFMALAGSSGDGLLSSPEFAIAAAIAFGIQWIVFVPSFLAQTERFYDLVGSMTYLSVTLFALSVNGDPRSVLLAALISLWALRLGSFLFLRIRAAGSDRRFDVIKTSFFRFLMTWTLQGLWVVMTAAAALAAMTSQQQEPLGVFAWAGLALWVGGFTVEVVADRQKSAFKRNPENEEDSSPRGFGHGHVIQITSVRLSYGWASRSSHFQRCRVGSWSH